MQSGNPFGWTLTITVIILLSILPLIWSRRKAPATAPILILIAGVIIWSMAYAMELFSQNLPEMLFWTKIEYLGIVCLPGSWLAFAWEYSGRALHFNKKWLLLLLVEPVLVVVLVWTAGLQLLISSATTVQVGGWVMLKVIERGPLFWIHSVYSYALMLIATLIMLSYLFRSPRFYQGQAGVLLLGAITPWAANGLYIFGLTQADFTPIGFAITGLSLAQSLSRFQLFNIVPVARDLLIDTLEDAVVILDGSDRVVEANRPAQAMLLKETSSTLEPAGFTRLEASWIGHSVREVFVNWREPVSELLKQGTGSIEIDLGSAQEPHWYEVRLSPFRSRLNRLSGLEKPSGKLLVFHDIHIRKQAETLMAEARDQALSASRLKSQLIANVSHDLRTPLTAILGFSDMLLDGVFDPLRPQQAEVIRQIGLSAHQVSLFVGDLLDQSLIEGGKLKLNTVPFHLQDLTGLIRSLTGQMAVQKGLDLNFSIDPGMPEEVKGDLKRLQQILMNLVGNALKFTDEGSVNVSLFKQDEAHWVMQVSDTGCGIPKEAQAFIFEPFRQVDGNSVRKGGVGLGLAIVHQLVTNMGGSVELDSVVDQGSTFRIILPL